MMISQMIRNQIRNRSLSALLVFLLSPAIADAETPLVNSNSWAFTLPLDSFSHDAVLDLRSLNEQQSGETGFVALITEQRLRIRRGVSMIMNRWN